jgi:RNA polymerase sigma factor (sigma-70 family)
LFPHTERGRQNDVTHALSISYQFRHGGPGLEIGIGQETNEMTNEKVLIVDDDATITEGLKAFFELESINATTAFDRESAEALIELDYYPVVLADLRLKSDEEGLKLVEAIRQRSPRSRVASMTGYATPEMRQRLEDLGASVVFEKPFAVESILGKVRELLTDLARPESENLEELHADIKRTGYAIAGRRFGLTSDEVEDVLQEAWALFFEKGDMIRTPRAWFSGTIANLCKQRIQKNSNHRQRYEALDAIDSMHLESYSAVNADHDEVLSVRQALARVDDRTRQLCTLIGMEGLSYDEVSEQLGLPIGSVGPLYIRAKKKLRREIEMVH